MAAISLAGVSKTFVDGTHAVADLDLDIGDANSLPWWGRPGVASRRCCGLVPDDQAIIDAESRGVAPLDAAAN